MVHNAFKHWVPTESPEEPAAHLTETKLLSFWCTKGYLFPNKKLFLTYVCCLVDSHLCFKSNKKNQYISALALQRMPKLWLKFNHTLQFSVSASLRHTRAPDHSEELTWLHIEGTRVNGLLHWSTVVTVLWSWCLTRQFFIVILLWEVDLKIYDLLKNNAVSSRW